MATSTSNLAFSNANFANYSAWATAISNALASFGWIQQNDTGQVVWTATVLTITDVTASGGNAIYSFSSYTGPAPRIGMSVIITGFATGANNVTATITALTGTTSGTFTVVKVAQVNETHAASGTTTAVSTVPATGGASRDYEIWGPGDGLTAFYLKMEYGTAGASSPTIRISLATGTNGAGTLSGTVTGTATPTTTDTGNSATLVECDFSGSTSRFAALMWRNSNPFFFGIERSVDSSGAYNGDGVALWLIGGTSNVILHKSIGFTAGTGGIAALGQAVSYFPRILTQYGNGNSSLVGTNIALSPTFAEWGKYSNAFTLLAISQNADVVEGATVTSTQYGVSRTYIATKSFAFTLLAQPGSSGQSALLLRYD